MYVVSTLRGQGQIGLYVMSLYTFNGHRGGIVYTLLDLGITLVTPALAFIAKKTKNCIIMLLVIHIFILSLVIGMHIIIHCIIVGIF